MSSFDAAGLDPALMRSLGLDRPAEEAKPGDKLGQEDFLKLMIAQFSHQDPFDPMDNGEFLGQIAQFGTVSGIQELQQSFESFSSSMQSNQALQAAGLVGREVMIPANHARLGEGDGAGINGAVTVPGGTENVLVTISDLAGNTVRQIPLGPQAAGVVDFRWDGMTGDGERAAPGHYEIRAEAMMGGRAEAMGLLIGAEVESVTLGAAWGGGISLRLAGLGEVDLADVIQIR